MLEMKYSLYKFKFRLCLEVKLDWMFWFTDLRCVRLAESCHRRLDLYHTFDHGRVVCTGLLMFRPIGLHASTTLELRS